MESTPAQESESNTVNPHDGDRRKVELTPEMRADIARHRTYSAIIEEVWGPRVEPVTKSLLLDSSLEHDFYPTEAEYGGTVQLLLEDEGWEPAQEFVLASRDWLANALDHGIEPSEVVQYVIAKY